MPPHLDLGDVRAAFLTPRWSAQENDREPLPVPIRYERVDAVRAGSLPGTPATR